MAGGGQGAGPAQGTSGLPPTQEAASPGGIAMQSSAPIDSARLQDIYNAKLASGQIGMGQTGGSFAPPEWANAQLQQMQRGAGPLPTGGQLGGAATYGRGYADGGQIGMNSYADPNQNFMQYQGQGQPNQPMSFGLLGNTPPVQGYDVPDATGRDPSNNMGFDGSGSDSGVAGRPVDIPQNPLQPSQQGNKPLGLAQFQQPQGLQIAGNPTSQIVQRPQQR